MKKNPNNINQDKFELDERCVMIMNNLINNFNENTPLCIIYYISEYIGLNIDLNNKDIVYIASIIFTIKNKWLYPENPQDIARFINANIDEWKTEDLNNLFQSFQFFISNNINYNEYLLDSKFKIIENNRHLQELIMYKECLKMKIKIKSNFTYLHMIKKILLKKIRLYFNLEEKRSFSLEFSLKTLESDQRPNLAIESDQRYNLNQENNWFSLLIYMRNVKNFYNLNICRLKNEFDCIIIAAKIYKKDISRSFFPERELYNIINGLGTYDKKMIFVENLNENSYNIDINFSRYFPCIFYYETESLRNNKKYENKYVKSLINKFEPGYFHQCINVESIIDLEEFNNMSKIISYGNSENMVAYLCKELIDTFNTYKSFCNPINGEHGENFKRKDIKKLKNICIQKNYLDLLCKINEVEEIESSVEIKIHIFLDFVDLNENNYIKTKDVFSQIITLMKYMRFWDGETKEFPLEGYSKEGYVEITDKNDRKMADIIYNLWEKYKNPSYKHILDLPILNKQFKMMFKNESYVTLYDKILKLTLVKKTSACIRTTSNYLCYTMYYITLKMENYELFDISKLSEIK